MGGTTLGSGPSDMLALELHAHPRRTYPKAGRTPHVLRQAGTPFDGRLGAAHRGAPCPPLQQSGGTGRSTRAAPQGGPRLCGVLLHGDRVLWVRGQGATPDGGNARAVSGCAPWRGAGRLVSGPSLEGGITSQECSREALRWQRGGGDRGRVTAFEANTPSRPPPSRCTEQRPPPSPSLRALGEVFLRRRGGC